MKNKEMVNGALASLIAKYVGLSATPAGIEWHKEMNRVRGLCNGTLEREFSEVMNLLEDHSRALGLHAQWEAAAAAAWAIGGGNDFMAANFDDMAQDVTSDAKAIALFIATDFAIDAIKDRHDEAAAWQWLYNARKFEGVLTSAQPEERMAQALREAGRRGGIKGAATRKRRAINPAEVMKLAAGLTTAALAKRFGCTQSNIRIILKKEQQKSENVGG